MDEKVTPDSQQRLQSSREEIPVPPVGDDTWKLILDRSNVPIRIQHEFLGEKWVYDVDEDGRQIPNSGRWEQKGERLMNEKGARFFTTIMISAMTPDKITTMLLEDEVKDMLRGMRKNVVLLIGQREDEFNILPSDRSIIVQMIDDYCRANLTNSRKGFMMRSMKPTIERKETISMPKKEGWFSR